MDGYETAEPDLRAIIQPAVWRSFGHSNGPRSVRGHSERALGTAETAGQHVGGARAPMFAVRGVFPVRE